MLRVLLAGEWAWNIYEAALAAALERQGAKVIPVQTRLKGDMRGRIQGRLAAGPAVREINRRLTETALRERPDVLFLHRPVLIRWQTVASLRALLPRLTTITYNNDNPFEDGRRLLWGRYSSSPKPLKNLLNDVFPRRLMWRRYFECARYADINFFYRPSNVVAAERHGIPRPRLLRPYYVEGLHRPNASARPCHDATFVGHYEPDGRLEFCEHLLNSGIRLTIFGTRWEEVPRNSLLRSLRARPVRNQEYVRILWGSKISLVFLSERNRDPYTRRCFEIPACGTMMLAPRTPELQELYEEGREADYFGDKEELLRKVTHYLTHEDHRRAVAAAGQARCLRDGHSSVDRADQILREVEQFRAQQRGNQG